MMKRWKLASLALVAAFALSGCSMAYSNSTVEPLVSQDVADSEAALDSLYQAETIVLKKHVISLGDRYDVVADDVKLGEIKGQFIYALGDTYSFFTEAGNLVASQGEDFRLVTHGAALFDYNNEPTGALSENFTLVLKNWDILNAEGEKIGHSQQNINLTLAMDVYNADGQLEYKINKDLISIGARLTITAQVSEPTIHPMDAVWLAAVSNEIHEAEQESSNN